MRLPKSLAAVAVIASLVLIASACGGSEPNANPTPAAEPLTVAEVLARSGEVMANLGTFHFQMVHEVGSTEFLPGLNVEDTSGDVQPPDRLYAEFSGLFGNIPINAKLIAIGDDNYMTNPLTGEWQEIDANVSPIQFFNPKEGISSVLDEVTGAVFVESGRDMYKLTGKVPASSLEALLGATVEDGVVDLEVEIDAHTLHLTLARFTGQVTPSDAPDTVRVVTLSKFDEPVNIEAPDIP